jgi:RNA polymerase sigma-70 factor (ECF subfamily)
LDERPDKKLVTAARRGQKEAYAELVKRYYRDVFAVCLGILGNVDDAEDIAQDAMLTGFLKIRKLHRAERFGWWIVQIAKNLCIDLLRRKKHVKAILSGLPVQSNRKISQNQDIHQSIRQLPLELRLPLVMYYFDNKSTEKIAEKFNISHSGVCNRIKEARKQLHKLLTGREK